MLMFKIDDMMVGDDESVLSERGVPVSHDTWDETHNVVLGVCAKHYNMCILLQHSTARPPCAKCAATERAVFTMACTRARGARASSDAVFSRRSSIVRAPRTNLARFCGSTAIVVNIVD